MKNYKIKTNFVSPDAIHDISVWLRTGSKPADSNWFQRHTGKRIMIFFVVKTTFSVSIQF